jgi:hypothetical protein
MRSWSRGLATVAALLMCGRVLGGDGEAIEPVQAPLIQRMHPVGGWSPYGGGLFHWWNRHCFPHRCAPDDYCRKPLPRVCWGPYPPWYTYGPPEICQARCGGR